MNIHTWFKKHIEYYFNGDLDSVEKRRFEHHFQKCKKCSSLKANYFANKAMRDGLSNIFSNPTEEDLKYTNCFCDNPLKEYSEGTLKRDEEQLIKIHLYKDNCTLCNTKVDTYRAYLKNKRLINLSTAKKALSSFPSVLAAKIKNIPLLCHIPIQPKTKYIPYLVPVLLILLIFIILPFLTPPLQLTKFESISPIEPYRIEETVYFEFSSKNGRKDGTDRSFGNEKPGGVMVKKRKLKNIPKNIFKISLTTNHNCHAYLFAIQDNQTKLITVEKILKKTEHIIPKEEWLRKKEAFILVLVKKPIKDTSIAKNIIIENYKKGRGEILDILKKGLKRKDILVKLFSSNSQ